MINISELERLIQSIEDIDGASFSNKISILYPNLQKKQISDRLGINEHSFRNYFKMSITSPIPLKTIIKICKDKSITLEEFMEV